MAKVKIKSTSPHRAGMELTLPNGLGQIKFDENCIAEVEQEVGEQIINMGINMEPHKETSDPADDDPDFEFTEESLSKLTIKQLKEVCSENTFPEADYKNKNKSQLIAYLLEKVNESEEKKETPDSADETNTVETTETEESAKTE